MSTILIPTGEEVQQYAVTVQDLLRKGQYIPTGLGALTLGEAILGVKSMAAKGGFEKGFCDELINSLRQQEVLVSLAQEQLLLSETNP